MKTITIELDIEKLKERLAEEAISRTVRDYFEAADIEEYDKRSAIKSKRLKNIIDEVDWNKLPEELQRSMLRKFIERIIR